MVAFEDQMEQWQKEREESDWGCCTFGCLWWLFSFPVAVVVHLLAWAFEKRKR